MYTLKIKDKNGNNINEITNHKGFSFDYELNREGSCNIPVNIDLLGKFTMDNLYPRKSYLDIFRYNTKVWSGIFSDVTGDIGTDSGNMTLNFKGYLWLLKRMFIGPSGKIFTITDQGSIIWNLINAFQTLPNGDYGITFGSINTNLLRDRTYKAFKNVYEAAIELTEVINGCDLDISVEKVLNVYARKGHRLGHVFEYGKNVSGFSFSIGGDVINQSYGVGSGEGENILYSTAHNMQSQEEYGLCQGVIVKSDVIILDTLTQTAQGQVDEFNNPTSVLGIDLTITNDPPLMAYLTGDEIRVKISKGWFDFDNFLRIKKISVDVDTEEKESVRVEFL